MGTRVRKAATDSGLVWETRLRSLPRIKGRMPWYQKEAAACTVNLVLPQEWRGDLEESALRVKRQ